MNDHDIDPEEARLNDYLDGELSEADARAFETVLAERADVREKLDATRALLAHARALPNERTPERDLWNGIQERLDADKARSSSIVPGPWMGVMLAAAAAVFLLTVPPLIFERAQTVDDSPPHVAAPAGPGEDYRDAKEALLAVLEERRGDIPQETLDTVTENLAIIETAVAEIELALADDPDNPALERLLAAAYHGELELLQRAVRATP